LQRSSLSNSPAIPVRVLQREELERPVANKRAHGRSYGPRQPDVQDWANWKRPVARAGDYAGVRKCRRASLNKPLMTSVFSGPPRRAGG
jgi:hypothetical protein